MGFKRKINKACFKLDLKAYQSARELFAAVREAAHDAECIVKRVQSMPSFKDVTTLRHHAASSAQKVFVDRVPTADKKPDNEDAISKRLQEDYALIDTATIILYGHDGSRGIRFSLGDACADVLWWRYLRYSRWSKVASIMGHSATWCCQLADIALDTIDAVGFERAAEGIGGLYVRKVQALYDDEELAE